MTAEAVKAFGGLDKCFAAEPIPDGVWARMQGKTYKENPHIGRDDLRHVRALHWDYDNQMHVGEMVCNKVIADRVATILRQLFDAKYPIQRMLLPDVYDADDETQMRDNNSSCFCYRNIAGSTNLSKRSMRADWLSTSIRSTTLITRFVTTARYLFNQPQQRHTVTATGTSPTKSTAKISASVSSRRLALSGVATGYPQRVNGKSNCQWPLPTASMKSLKSRE